MMALTWHSLRFECLSSQLASSFLMIDLDARLTWQMEWTTPFDQLVVVAKMGALLFRSLSEV